eukprot:NODE_653_length_1729_cov_810.581149_g643_i0.p1 GENE.NODE_653_length_1729_cov_810.581149_g643_i0~~NODE_653_length_1729_cov_810.581149_g643_i0.p1  ORF type:complete len:518 (-),score=119.68 NODE_653_length_1729_cov_810.581149_g643_i0:102-1655(-)
MAAQANVIEAVEEVGYKTRPPLLEDVSIEGPLRIPIPHALDTMEQRDAIEEDYNWFRYSKFAGPMLIILLVLSVILFCLTAFTQVGDLKGLRSGTPRYYQLQIDSDDGLESGGKEKERNLRLATCIFTVFPSLAAFCILGLKFRPNLRKALMTIMAILLFVGFILAMISFGLHEDDRPTACQQPDDLYFITREPCESRVGLATAALAVDFAVGMFALVAAIVLVVYTFTGDFKLLRDGWREQERDAEQEPSKTARGNIKAFKVRETRIVIVSIALGFVLLLGIAAGVFATVLHQDHNTVLLRSFRGRTSLHFDNPPEQPFEEAGWSARNTRIRYALTGIAIVTILLNLMPFRSRVIAYLFAFVYASLIVLAMIAFGADVNDMRETRDFGCPEVPYGPSDNLLWRADVRSELAARNTKLNCINAPFVACAFFEFVLALALLFYLVNEFVVRMASVHSQRKYPWHQINEIEEALDSRRPVRDELTSEVVTAKQFFYQTRFVGGYPQTSSGSSDGLSLLQ